MARKEVVYELEVHSPTPYPLIEDWDEDIVETAGFIPLEVRFKQMEQAGFRAQFFESEFTSKDVSDMYLNHPEFDITGEDDIEEAMEKIKLREEYINQVKQEIMKRKGIEAEEKESAERAAEENEKPKDSSAQ